jgi:ankyrin repeat protein
MAKAPVAVSLSLLAAQAQEELVDAVHSADVAAIAAALEKGAQANLRDHSKADSLLTTATRRGQTHVMAALLAAGADPRLRDSDGDSVVWAALRSGSAEALRLAVRAREAVKPLLPPLLALAATGEPGTVARLLAEHAGGTAVADAVDGNVNLLHMAAALGDVELVEALLTADLLPLGRQDARGTTALMYAARGGHVAAMAALLSRPAGRDHVRSTDRQGWTALAHAAALGRDAAVRLLLEAGGLHDVTRHDHSGMTPLMRAMYARARDGSAATVRALLDADTSPMHGITAVDSMRMSPLTHAAAAGNAPALDVLLSAAKSRLMREQVDARMDALFAASTSAGSLACIRRLQEWGGNIRAWMTPHAYARYDRSLLTAVGSGDADTVALLMTLGQTPTVQVLCDAAAVGSVRVMRLLLAAAVPPVGVRSRDEQHRTPLMHAMMHGHVRMAVLLIEAGSDVAARSRSGKRTLDLVCGNRTAPRHAAWALRELIMGAPGWLRRRPAVVAAAFVVHGVAEWRAAYEW